MQMPVITRANTRLPKFLLAPLARASKKLAVLVVIRRSVG
jgi:hypothetical protein